MEDRRPSDAQRIGCRPITPLPTEKAGREIRRQTLIAEDTIDLGTVPVGMNLTINNGSEMTSVALSKGYASTPLISPELKEKENAQLFIQAADSSVQRLERVGRPGKGYDEDELDVGDGEVWHCMVTESVNPFRTKKDTQGIWTFQVTDRACMSVWIQGFNSKILTKGGQVTSKEHTLVVEWEYDPDSKQ
ncbi:unnamed protein product [Caretta caretta]